jgi:hypothetical protein
MPSINPANITFAAVESLRAAATGGGNVRDWRNYTLARARYREWTLQRLAKIEAGEESDHR